MKVDACVFDAYGTLFDVHSAVAAHRDRLPAGRAERASELWRTRQLEYTWLRSLMRRHADFWQVTADALDFALAAVGAADDALRRDLLEAYLGLKGYPEVPSVLERLRAAGLRTAILSNGSPAMLAAAVEHAGLGKLLDAVWSIEEVGVFKPHPDVYRIATDRLKLESGRIVFLTANAWDAAGASVFGLRVAWINRTGQPPERLPGSIDAELRTLGELPGLLGLD